MDFIVSTAFPIVKCVLPCASSEIGYILSYEKNLEGLESEVQRLKDTQDKVQHDVEEAIRKADKIEDVVENWKLEAESTVKEAQNLVNMEVGYCLGQCPNLWTRNRLSRKFEEMTKKISKVIDNGKFDRVSYRVSPKFIDTPIARDYVAVDSRTSRLNEIKEALKDPNIYMIGVHGMGGVGKTKLVEELAWHVDQDGSFGAVAIALVTDSPDVKKIQDRISEQLSGQKLGEESGGRAAELRQRIQQQKSVLIILDDIWRSSQLNLREVGIPFGDDHKGCKLLVTSRFLNELQEMGSQKEFDLRALQENDSWDLFEKMAGDVVKQVDIKPIAERVANCCGGLPLLIVTVAKGLRKKDVSAWNDAVTQLEALRHEDLQNKVFPTLELSFNFLGNDQKSLFLFIGSCDLDIIHTGELFLCCWGLGFYDDLKLTLTEARDRHYKLINDIRASSLLLEADNEPEWIKMHDVVRDVAKSIASRFHLTYAVQRFTKMIEWPKADLLQKCHYIIIPGNYSDEIPEKLECPELELLVLVKEGDRLKISDNFFSGMRKVRTLDLGGMDFTHYLPPSLHLLGNLRSLFIYNSNLGDIRTIGKLKNLEILYLERSNIEELPKEIASLTHLRLLSVANCSKLRVIPRNLISSLTCLEELYMGNCHIEWELDGSQNESNNASLGELRNLHNLKTLDISIRDTSVLPEDLRFLSKLQRYNILIGDMWEWSIEWSGGALETSRTLKLTDSMWTIISLTTVEDLSFANLKDVKDVYQLNDGFPQLKHLHIQESDELVHIINSKEMPTLYSAFPNLETLVLLNLQNMKEICYGPYPEHSFVKLQVIKVEGCDSLKNLLSYSLLKNLSQLHEMEITGCKNMKEIIALDEKEVPAIVLPELHSLKLKGLPMLLSFCLPQTVQEDNQPIPLHAMFNQKVVMPKLEALVLSEINTCKIWDDILPVDSCIQNLTSLAVGGCDRLTSLFSSSVARALAGLQSLLIYKCSMLKDIFVQEEEQVGFPNLKTLRINMCDLKSIWPNKMTPNSFPKLKEVFFENCKGFDYVFPISVAKELRQLQYLEINQCAIKNIVEESVEESDCYDMTHVCLEKLFVRNCHNMNSIVQSFVLFEALDELEVFRCNGVVNIRPPSMAKSLPKLQILRISECDKLEEIYGSKNENGAPHDEIVFMKLKELTLKHLPRLTSFCQGSYNFYFQLLQMVELHNCPRMEIFCHGKLTTPMLKKVLCGGREEHCNGDLNTMIRTIFPKKNTEQDFSHDQNLKTTTLIGYRWRY